MCRMNNQVLYEEKFIKILQFYCNFNVLLEGVMDERSMRLLTQYLKGGRKFVKRILSNYLYTYLREGLKNTTIVFPAARKKRPKWTQQEIWEVASLYSLLQKDEVKKGRSETNIYLEPKWLPPLNEI